METISDVQVEETLRAVVAERGPEYVYPQEWKVGVDGPYSGVCMYVRPDGQGPACIAGAVFFRLGASLAFLLQQEGDNAAPVVRELERAGVLRMSQQASLLIRYAQDEQDRGKPWGEALEIALRRSE